MRKYLAISVLTLGVLALSACKQNTSIYPAPVQPVVPPVQQQQPAAQTQPVVPTQPATSPQQAVTESTVSISNFSFNPQNVVIKAGTTVTWTNDDQIPHTVTGDAGGPASGQLNTGDRYQYTFNIVGKFFYHCSNHPSMTASVTVIQ